MTKARTNADNASADIQGVTAGTGLSGGGTSGTVTLTNDMATAIDAKGDLVVGTGADTYSRLATGNNGETLVADSSTSTGLRWQAPTVNTVVDAKGDLLAGSAADTITRLPLGSNGQVLKVNTATATGLEWSADSAGMTNPMTTTGDTIYASSGSTPTRLGIGSTGQVLTVSGGVPAWATPASSNSNWSLLNAGGTALTGAATITISGISGREAILVLFKNASSANAGSKINVRMNGDTAGNYYYSQNFFSVNTAYTPGVIEGLFRDGDTFVRLGAMADTASGQVNGHLLIQGCNTSGLKVFQGAGAGTTGTNNGQQQSVVGGYYNSSSTISSISLFSDFGNFDNGTVYVYATN